MQWSMVGWSHHRTPVEVRERLAFSREQVCDALSKFSQRFPETESVLLSTCNRVELYCAAHQDERMPSTEDIGRFMADYHNFPYSDVQSQLTKLSGKESIQHLFMVAASLDSMVVGEAQILSQVRAAYELACQGESASTLMHQAFQRATVVARRVTNETEIHKRRISIPSVAVSEIAADFFERFDDKRILLIGAGEMGTETLRYLIDADAKSITIINRSQERAHDLAQQFGAEVVPWEQLYAQIAEADLIVSTTGAQQPVVKLQEFRKARAKRSARAVLVLDLAIPRDFEAPIGDLADVYLFCLDDLQQVCNRNLQARKEQWPKAQQIVEQETQKFLAENTHRGSGPTIMRLREQAEKVKQDEFRRLTAKLEARGMDEESKQEVARAFDRLVNKLLHPPLQSLRENADTAHHATLIDALRRLFQLKD